MVHNRSFLVAIPYCIVLLTNGGEHLERYSFIIILTFRSDWVLCCLVPFSTPFGDPCSHRCCLVYHRILYIDHAYQRYLHQYVYFIAYLEARDQNLAALIAWRIYRTRRFMPDGLTALLPVLIVIVESGALYATTVLALLVTFLTGSNGQYTVLDIVTPIVVSLLG